MGENSININKLSFNNLSRITPVALVIGTAGFLGSNLVDKLLEKAIQVIGVDDFSTGQKTNLAKAIQSKNFYLVNQSAEYLNLDLPRLDYLYIVAEGNWNTTAVFNIARQYKAKTVLVSSIDLYDNSPDQSLDWFKKTESGLAKLALDHKLNARIVRLSSIYGPRMHFRNSDPTTRLIQAKLINKLQDEATVLEFSSRAIFVEDAVNLIIKTNMAGSTALKIFDGALLVPVKVTEVKQVLLDPVWFEVRGFKPEPLPPWPTPNLVKTIKELSWQPQISLVKALKETLSFFKHSEQEIPELAQKETRLGVGSFGLLDPSDWQKEKERRLGQEKESDQEDKKEQSLKKDDQKEEQPAKETKSKSASSYKKRVFLGLICFGIIFYGLIWPVLELGVNIGFFRANLAKAAQSLEKGEFDKGLSYTQRSKEAIDSLDNWLEAGQVVSKMGFLTSQYDHAKSLMTAAKQSVAGSEHALLGTKQLYQGLGVVSGGESTQSAQLSFDQALIELQSADLDFSKAAVRLNDKVLKDNLSLFQDRINDLATKVDFYGQQVRQTRLLAAIFPQLLGFDGKKSYLILIENNTELRPTGGLITALARIDFDKGRLIKTETRDVYDLEKQLKIHVEPPKEIKEDLGQKDFLLHDANFEPDFPTSARQVQWFYHKITGQLVDGVVSLDVTSLESLLAVVGAVSLTDLNQEVVSADNVFEKAASLREASGSGQFKTNLLSSLQKQLLNQLFFNSNQNNWLGVTNAVSQSLDQKHLLVYLTDPKLLAFITSQNWSGVLPRPLANPPEQSRTLTRDVIAFYEANLGANKANYYLERKVNLETTFGKTGEINHNLKISYTNRSPSNIYPAGKYKNRLRVYVPFGSTLKKISYGQSDLTQKVTTFVEYGRTGYSLLLEVLPKEQKILSFEYQLPNKLNLQEPKTKYSLDFIKQPGTLKDPLDWKLNFPSELNITDDSSGQGKATSTTSPLVITTDLSKDRRFEVQLTR